MSGRDNIPDDSADRASAVSPDIQVGANGLAEVWVRSVERQQADALFEALVRAVQAEFLTAARAMARTIVAAGDVDDAISMAWKKIMTRQRRADGSDADQGSPGRTPGGFDPNRGSFRTYFFTVLWSTCKDIRRSQGAMPQPYDDDAVLEDPARGIFPSIGPGFEDGALETIVSIEDRISDAIEVLDFTDQQRDLLRSLLEPEKADPSADPEPVGTRKQKQRLRERVTTKLAELTRGN